MTATEPTTREPDVEGRADGGASLSRRRVLAAAGAVGAVGVLAACSSGSGGSQATTSAAAETASQAPAESATPTDTSAGGLGGGTVLGPTSAIAVGGGAVYEGPKVVVTQPTAGTYNGFTAVCPHQGCLVNEVVDNEISCPCHGSKFSGTDGSVIQGPAAQGLAAAAVSVEGSDVVLA